MAKNNKRKGLESANYWPGYVDALVNVVLNMLFMVGIMAVGLICLNIEALGNHKRAWQAEQLQQLNEESMLLAALGTFMAALPDVVPPKPEPKKPEPAPKVAIAPAPAPKADAPVLPRNAPPLVMRVARGQGAGTLAEERQMIQTRMDWRDPGVVTMLEFDSFSFQTTQAHVALIKQWAAQPGGSWMLAVAVDGNDWAAREGFWRLSAVRQQLIAAGVGPETISARTVPALPAGTGSSRRLFIAHHR